MYNKVSKPKKGGLKKVCIAASTVSLAMCLSPIVCYATPANELLKEADFDVDQAGKILTEVVSTATLQSAPVYPNVDSVQNNVEEFDRSNYEGKKYQGEHTDCLSYSFINDKDNKAEKEDSINEKKAPIFEHGISGAISEEISKAIASEYLLKLAPKVKHGVDEGFEDEEIYITVTPKDIAKALSDYYDSIYKENSDDENSEIVFPAHGLGGIIDEDVAMALYRTYLAQNPPKVKHGIDEGSQIVITPEDITKSLTDYFDGAYGNSFDNADSDITFPEHSRVVVADDVMRNALHRKYLADNAPKIDHGIDETSQITVTPEDITKTLSDYFNGQLKEDADIEIPDHGLGGANLNDIASVLKSKYNLKYAPKVKFGSDESDQNDDAIIGVTEEAIAKALADYYECVYGEKPEHGLGEKMPDDVLEALEQNHIIIVSEIKNADADDESLDEMPIIEHGVSTPENTPEEITKQMQESHANDGLLCSYLSLSATPSMQDIEPVSENVPSALTDTANESSTSVSTADANNDDKPETHVNTSSDTPCQTSDCVNYAILASFAVALLLTICGVFLLKKQKQK